MPALSLVEGQSRISAAVLEPSRAFPLARSPQPDGAGPPPAVTPSGPFLIEFADDPDVLRMQRQIHRVNAFTTRFDAVITGVQLTIAFAALLAFVPAAIEIGKAVLP